MLPNELRDDLRRIGNSVRDFDDPETARDRCVRRRDRCLTVDVRMIAIAPSRLIRAMTSDFATTLHVS